MLLSLASLAGALALNNINQETRDRMPEPKCKVNPNDIPDLGWKLVDKFSYKDTSYSFFVITALVVGIALVCASYTYSKGGAKALNLMVAGFAVLFSIRAIGMAVTFFPLIYNTDSPSASSNRLRKFVKLGSNNEVMPSGHTITGLFPLFFVASYFGTAHPAAVGVLSATVILGVLWSHLHRTEDVFFALLICAGVALLISRVTNRVLVATLAAAAVVSALAYVYM